MTLSDRAFDVLAFGAHPDDLEVAMGGTAAKLAKQGLRLLFVDLTDGEPARYAQPNVRREQAVRAAATLGVERLVAVAGRHTHRGQEGTLRMGAAS